MSFLHTMRRWLAPGILASGLACAAARAPGEAATAPREGAPPSREAAPASREGASAPREGASAPREGASAPRRAEPAPATAASAPCKAARAPKPEAGPLGTAPRPMPLISRGVPAYASDGDAVLANDARYGGPDGAWTSAGYPAWLALDLGGVPPARRGRILVAWYNPGYGYASEAPDGAGGWKRLTQDWTDGQPSDYVIEGHAGVAAGPPPAAGWVTLAMVTGYRAHSRTHLLDFAGYRWLRLRFTQGNPFNASQRVALNLDVHDASAANDSWVFVGDSITANTMMQGDDAASSPNFAQRIHAQRPDFWPAFEDAGIASEHAIQEGPARVAFVLGQTAAHYVSIAYGTNDGGFDQHGYAFYDAYAAMIDQVLASGRIPVVPTIIWSNDASIAARVGDPADADPAHRYLLNVQLAKLKADYRAHGKTLLDGPDLWTYFKARPALLQPGGLHPTNPEGHVAYRALWADWAATHVYGGP